MLLLAWAMAVSCPWILLSQVLQRLDAEDRSSLGMGGLNNTFSEPLGWRKKDTWLSVCPEETLLTDVLTTVLLPNSPKQLKLALQIELLCNPCLRSPSIWDVGRTRGFNPGSKGVKHTETSSYEGSRPQKLACKWACVILAMNCAAV